MNRFPPTSIQPRCSYTHSFAYLVTWSTRRIHNVPRGNPKYCRIALAGFAARRVRATQQSQVVAAYEFSEKLKAFRSFIFGK